MTPRTSDQLPTKNWIELGAMIDASRGHPVAFWSDPGREPQEVDVGSGTFHPAQWLTHLALRMNEAIAKRTLFDSRLAAVGPKLFKWELRAGRYHYSYKAKRAKTLDMIRRSHARAVELQFKSAHEIKMGSDTGVRLLVEAHMGTHVRSYAVDSTSASNWDVDCMNQLARRILGDADFWAAAKLK
ncbi:MAG: hypothetical protein KC502_16905 [Myxococcales bacterium]|nr:hypothetical protein [Myxococcales bacterium]